MSTVDLKARRAELLLCVVVVVVVRLVHVIALLSLLHGATLGAQRAHITCCSGVVKRCPFIFEKKKEKLATHLRRIDESKDVCDSCRLLQVRT